MKAKSQYVSETAFRKSAMAQLKRLPNSKFFSIQQLAIRGTPDVLGVVRGRFVALEFKKEEKSTRSTLQVLNICQINASGGVGVFCHPGNWGEIYKILTALSKGEEIDRAELQNHSKPGILLSSHEAREVDGNP